MLQMTWKVFTQTIRSVERSLTQLEVILRLTKHPFSFKKTVTNVENYEVSKTFLNMQAFVQQIYLHMSYLLPYDFMSS
jgi:hypothetical protein